MLRNSPTASKKSSRCFRARHRSHPVETVPHLIRWPARFAPVLCAELSRLDGG